MAKLSIVQMAKHVSYANGNVNVAIDLACEHARLGHRVTFCSEGGALEPVLARNDVKSINMVQDQKKLFHAMRSVQHLLSLCREVNADVIHAHMMGGAAISAIVSRITGIPLVTTVHNSFDAHATIMKLGKRIVAVSEAERQLLIKRNFSPEKLRVIWNGSVNSPRHEGQTWPNAPVLNRPNILLLCGLHRRKGVGDVIEAFKKIAPTYSEWSLYIAGSGPDEAELRAHAAATEFGSQIVFLGNAPIPDMLYQQTDIFVLASYADPGSLTICEARAAGCAIIATNVGGTPEMLQHGNCGILVEPGHSDQMACALSNLMSDPSMRNLLGARAKKGAEFFQTSRVAADYLDLYREVVGENRKFAI